jgi:hypothetical protein
MKKLIIALAMIIALSMLAGCAAGGMIPAIKNLKPEDIARIELETGTSIDTLTDPQDIAICLADLKYIMLTKKTDQKIGRSSRVFRFLLSDGKTVEVELGNRLVGCNKQTYGYDGSESNVARGEVLLLTKGETYKPYAMIGYFQDIEGLMADFVTFGPEAMNDSTYSNINRLEEIPYADDFVFECAWSYDPEKVIEPTYSVFDENLSLISYCTTDFDMPDKSGVYYVTVNVCWGTDYHYAGYQYIFKITRN